MSKKRKSRKKQLPTGQLKSPQQGVLKSFFSAIFHPISTLNRFLPEWCSKLVLFFAGAVVSAIIGFYVNNLMQEESRPVAQQQEIANKSQQPQHQKKPAETSLAKSLQLVNALEIGAIIDLIPESKFFKPKQEKISDNLIERYYCTPEMYLVVGLDTLNTIQDYLVVAKSAKFRPKLPEGEILGKYRFIDKERYQPDSSVLISFREEYVGYFRVVYEARKQNGGRQLLIGHYAIGAQYPGAKDFDTGLFSSDIDFYNYKSEESDVAKGIVKNFIPNAFSVGNRKSYLTDNGRVIPFWVRWSVDQFECQ